MKYQDFLQEMQGDPFHSLIDGEWGAQINGASGPCAAVLRDILGGLSARGIAGLKQLNGNAGTNSGGPSVNTFPFGEKTHRIFPDYIGIACTNGTSLWKVLDSAERHCWDMELHLDSWIDKTVIILTDKWDQGRFQRDYEKLFLRYALRDRVLFMFILVNDYGVSPIPFLPWDRRKLENLSHSYRQMGGLDEIKALDSLLKEHCCEFEIRSHSRDGESRTVYHFNFFNRNYSWETETYSYNREFSSKQDNQYKSGKLNAQRVLEFASAVSDLSSLPEVRYQEEPLALEADMGYIVHILHIFGKEFVWGPGLGEFEKIQDAVKHLVDALQLRGNNKSAS